ncbi:MAG TPA: hypothetical protein DD640_02840 [Clostridiales bacterium]|nr:hypothetical protein [Clostridiales bacterium]
MSQPLIKKPDHRRWYRLDNAAKIFPALTRSRHNSVFRLAVLLCEPVNPELLQQALEKTLLRFPFFAVRLKPGLFWYYLESFADRPLVEPDVQNPMRPFTHQDEKSYLFRVRYNDRRIAVEFFHALTDGTGALVFLKTLTGAYLNLKGIVFEPDAGTLDIKDKPAEAEMEDAYNRFSDFRMIRRHWESRAFHLQGTIDREHNLKIICGIIAVDKITAAARRFKVSVTEFLVGVYLFQLYQIQQQGGYNTLAPVRISVPINVRRFYPTRTLRNFALYTNPGIEPAYGTYTLEEVIGLVHHFLRYTVTEKYLNALMCANVRPEKNMLMRLSPLILKNLVMRLVYAFTGESRFTSTLSNLGATQLPAGMTPHVERLEFLLGASHLNPVNCSVISTGSCLTVNFTGSMTETAPQRAFFKELVRLGVPVRVESNLTYGE